MKRILYILILTSCLVGVFNSCNNEPDTIFDKDPSQRVREASSDFLDLLVAPQYGWIFQYFPNPEQKYGGFNYFLKFKRPNQVEVKAESHLTSLVGETSVESDFDIVYSSGITLTFNTYNKLFHYFANPSVSEYLAKQGDFEFRVMSQSEEEIILKGTKTGNYLRLTKLDKPVDDYIEETNKVVDFVSGAIFKTTIGEKSIYPSMTASNRQIKLPYVKSDEEILAESAFVYTDKGIRLYKSLEIEGVKFQEFTLDKENNKLISLDGKLEINMKKPEVLKIFNGTVLTYGKGFAGKVSDKVEEAIQNVSNINRDRWAAYGVSIFPLFVLQNSQLFMVANSSTLGARWNIAYNLIFTVPTYDQDTLVHIIATNAGTEAGNNFFHIDEFAKFMSINSPYKVEDSATEVKLTSTKDSDVWFVLKK